VINGDKRAKIRILATKDNMFKLHKNKLKRIYAEDEYCFVTVKTFGNQRIFKDKGKAEIFMGALRFLEKRGDFVLAAGVLLFDHFHLLLLPEKKIFHKLCMI